MWRKNEPDSPIDLPRHPLPSPPEGRRTASGAVIGPSTIVRGEISGEEDLVVDGTLEGGVNLSDHNVKVGASGRIKADVRGRIIVVEGEVVGDLYGSEQVTIRDSGRVEGNVTAPRVTLENGAKFRGSIDMQPQKETGRPAAGQSPDERRPAAAGTASSPPAGAGPAAAPAAAPAEGGEPRRKPVAGSPSSAGRERRTG